MTGSTLRRSSRHLLDAMNRLLAFGALVFALAACTAGAASSPSNIAPVATSSTPSAAVRVATPKPTATPIPTPTPKVGEALWRAYLDHQTEYAAAEKPALAAWADSFEPMIRVANGEAAWLVANPPDECYRPTYDTHAKGIELLQKGIELLQRGAATSDIGLISQGNAALQQELAMEAQSGDTYAASFEACGGSPGYGLGRGRARHQHMSQVVDKAGRSPYSAESG